SHGFQKLASACRKGFFDNLRRALSGCAVFLSLFPPAFPPKPGETDCLKIRHPLFTICLYPSIDNGFPWW
ncbi:MAG: hypothetical protein RR035_08360, partial [Oscillibacter sp.]